MRRRRASPFWQSKWPPDWPAILASLARWYGSGFSEVERLTLAELSFWHAAASTVAEREAQG